MLDDLVRVISAAVVDDEELPIDPDGIVSCCRLKSVARRDFERFQVQMVVVTLNLAVMCDILKGTTTPKPTRILVLS